MRVCCNHLRAAARFASVFVANRGEIACRVATACHDTGKRSSAGFDPAVESRDALHVKAVDEAVALKSSQPYPYMDSKAILAAARECGAEAIHPGYGCGFSVSSEARGVEETHSEHPLAPTYPSLRPCPRARRQFCRKTQLLLGRSCRRASPGLVHLQAA